MNALFYLLCFLCFLQLIPCESSMNSSTGSGNDIMDDFPLEMLPLHKQELFILLIVTLSFLTALFGFLLFRRYGQRCLIRLGWTTENKENPYTQSFGIQ